VIIIGRDARRNILFLLPFANLLDWLRTSVELARV
jgi:hypothetical protein